MSSRKNKSNNSWNLGSSNTAPVGNTIGLKHLEKLGCPDGLGLGRGNQRIVGNQQFWKQRGDALSKTGFKSKEEADRPLETILKEENPKRPVRYTEMACSKDSSNYLLKNFKGIIGKEVTKENFDLLCNDTNSERKFDAKQTSDTYGMQMYPRYSGENVSYTNIVNFQKSECQLLASEEMETCEENKMSVYNAEELNKQNSKCSKPQKKRKRKSKPRKKKQKHNSNHSGDYDVLDIASIEVINNFDALSKKQRKKKKQKEKSCDLNRTDIKETQLKFISLYV